MHTLLSCCCIFLCFLLHFWPHLWLPCWFFTVRLKNCPRNGCFTVGQATMTSMMHMYLEKKNTKKALFPESTGKKVRSTWIYQGTIWRHWPPLPKALKWRPLTSLLPPTMMQIPQQPLRRPRTKARRPLQPPLRRPKKPKIDGKPPPDWCIL